MLRVLVTILFTLSLSYSQNVTSVTDESIDSEFDDNFDSEFSMPEPKFDPLSGYNRVMTTFNDKAYTYMLKPVTQGYNFFVPHDIRYCVNNAFDNLKAPMRFVNNLLQGKFQNSLEELFRFVINTTLGVGGFGDAGKELFNVSRHDEDFGQTLGYWGVGSGFPIVLPFLGPSNLRDALGLVVDSYSSPTRYYLNDDRLSYEIRGYEAVNGISLRIDAYDTIKKDAIDLYPYLQDLYENNRKNAIEN